jgi:hypothetical protein
MQTVVDDPGDSRRVNCVLTSLAKSGRGEDAPNTGTLNIATMVQVQQPVRFFKPAMGIEIIVRACCEPVGVHCRRR